MPTKKKPIVEESVPTTEETVHVNNSTKSDESSDEAIESTNGDSEALETTTEPVPLPEKPKRVRKKKVVPEIKDDTDELVPENSIDEDESIPRPQEAVSESTTTAPKKKRKTKIKATPILTIESRTEIETQENRDDIIWHEIQNAHRTRRIMSGILSGVEQTENGKSIAVVDYKELRIIIPIKEMILNLQRNPSGQEYSDLMVRQNKILSNMLGAEVDFIVKGIDSKTRTAVASRKEAMLKKRQLFYQTPDSNGQCRIYEGRIVQARVIAVAEKIVRVEVFGVECSIMARDMSWEWIGDAHENYSVGDEILVKVLEIQGDSLEEISIKADAKSVTDNTSHENLKKCRVQSKYIGTVTDIHKGVVFIRLNNGVNAIAHSCYDRRLPGKKDDVGFAVTHIDEERGVAVGIITRIIKQRL